MNKSKKELYEENKKLKKALETYSSFWETDAIEEISNQFKFTKKLIYGISIGLLIASAFLLGLGW